MNYPTSIITLQRCLKWRNLLLVLLQYALKLIRPLYLPLTKRIQRDFGPDRFDQIPPHGRWQHFDVGGVARVDSLIKQWKLKGLDRLETTRRLIDLFFVAVLLDAGAGDVWKFAEPNTDQAYGRSEGIAVATLYMFKAGAFSGNGGNDVESVNGQSFLLSWNYLKGDTHIATKRSRFTGFGCC